MWPVVMPSRSWKTSTWPEVAEPAPIPIVMMSRRAAIVVAISAGTASKTINALETVQYVSESGNDANLGTSASPKRTIGGALTAAAANGQTGVRVAGGAYGNFNVVAGIDVRGGYDQSFAHLGGNGATTVTVTGGANTPGVTATAATVATKLSYLTIQGGNGSTATGSSGVLATSADRAEDEGDDGRPECLC